MKRSAILLAGAVAFDLGTMVVQGHAATDTYLKSQDSKKNIELLSFSFLKIDPINTASACTGNGGKVVQHDGSTQCQLPIKSTKGGN